MIKLNIQTRANNTEIMDPNFNNQKIPVKLGLRLERGVGEETWKQWWKEADSGVIGDGALDL